MFEYLLSLICCRRRASRAGPQIVPIPSTTQAPPPDCDPSLDQGETVSAAVYAYTALSTGSDTRILHVLPGTFDDPLDCTIEVSSLQHTIHKTRYKAISYCWEGKAYTQKIKLNGAAHLITKSAEEVLRHVRNEKVAQPVWIDSICIDQQNKEEKIEQIKNMGVIYSNAEETVAWMGTPEDDDDRALNFIDKHRELFSEVAYDDCADIKSLLALHDLDPRAYNWIDVMELTCRPWFSRVWVVQELALSRFVHVTYGHRSIQWEILIAAIRCCVSDIINLPERHSNFRSPEHHRSALMMDDIRKVVQRSQKISMQAALKISGSLNATEALDFVFAHLGILDEEQKAKLPQLDYSSEAGEAFVAATRVAIRESGDLSIMCRAEPSPAPWLPGLPSWVPDFSDVRLLLHPPLGLDTRFMPKHVVEELDFFVGRKPVFCGNRMSVNGALLDEVSYVSTVYVDETDKREDFMHANSMIEVGMDGSANPSDGKMWWLSWAKQVIAASTEGRNVQEVNTGMTELAVTLCGNSFDSPEVCTRRFMLWQQLFLSGRHNDGPFIKETVNYLRRDWFVETEAREEAIAFASRFESLCCGRKFYITKSGCFGIGPRTAQVGDQVCVLIGSAWPFLLRRAGGHGSSDPRFHLVGSCYFNDLRKREVLDANSFGLLELV